MIQQWECDTCKMKGSVRFKKHAGVYEVAATILGQHRSKSPDCSGGKDTIRVVPQ